MACDSFRRETPALVARTAGPRGQGGAGGSGGAIIIKHHGDQTVLSLQGELDVANAESLRRAISSVLGLRPTLVLELSALRFADCSGLSVLVWAHQQLAERGHQLIVTPGQPMVNRLLHLTGLDTYLHFSAPLPGRHES